MGEYMECTSSPYGTISCAGNKMGDLIEFLQRFTKLAKQSALTPFSYATAFFCSDHTFYFGTFVHTYLYLWTSGLHCSCICRCGQTTNATEIKVSDPTVDLESELHCCGLTPQPSRWMLWSSISSSKMNMSHYVSRKAIASWTCGCLIYKRSWVPFLKTFASVMSYLGKNVNVMMWTSLVSCCPLSVDLIHDNKIHNINLIHDNIVPYICTYLIPLGMNNPKPKKLHWWR